MHTTPDACGNTDHRGKRTADDLRKVDGMKELGLSTRTEKSDLRGAGRDVILRESSWCDAVEFSRGPSVRAVLWPPSVKWEIGQVCLRLRVIDSSIQVLRAV